MALGTASGVIYVLATNDVLTLNGQSQGILTVLVFGAATDYALLLVSRYREELHRNESPFAAMRKAWRSVLEPLAASAATVCLGLLCLLFSLLNSNKSTGPVAATGIVCAFIATMTLLPALLVVPAVAVYLLLLVIGLVVALVVGLPALIPVWAIALLALFVYAGLTRRAGRGPSWAFWLRWPAARWVFWPKVPRFDSADEKLVGIWAKAAGRIGRRARISWVMTAVALLVAAFFVTTLKADGISQSDAFTSKPDSVVGQEELGRHFPAGSGNPAVIIANAASAHAVTAAAEKVNGVAGVVPFTGAAGSVATEVPADPKVVDGLVQLEATLTAPSDSVAAEDAITDLRAAVRVVPGADAKVGGFTAINLDTQEASRRDRTVIIPIVLLVILLILMLLLRSIVAPILLVLTVVLSFVATLGVCALVFNHVFHFAGADSSFPLFAFTFLVALGVDYNIFLMTRVREEAHVEGTRRGILKGLTVTGGVITSAGVVLAGTFSVLGTPAAGVPGRARVRGRLRRAARHVRRALDPGAGPDLRHRPADLVAEPAGQGRRALGRCAVKVALVGYGLAGRVFHAPLVTAAPGMELSVVVTGNAERQAQVRSDHPAAEVVASTDELFSRPGSFDLLVVAATNDVHASLGLAAVGLGKAVVVDKPLAMTVVEARELVTAAAETDVPLTVFQNRRWDSDQLTLRRLLADGSMGGCCASSRASSAGVRSRVPTRGARPCPPTPGRAAARPRHPSRRPGAAPVRCRDPRVCRGRCPQGRLRRRRLRGDRAPWWGPLAPVGGCAQPPARVPAPGRLVRTLRVLGRPAGAEPRRRRRRLDPDRRTTPRCPATGRRLPEGGLVVPPERDGRLVRGDEVVTEPTAGAPIRPTWARWDVFTRGRRVAGGPLRGARARSARTWSTRGRRARTLDAPEVIEAAPPVGLAGERVERGSVTGAVRQPPLRWLK